jgi:GntR family transcriptional regulator
VIKVDPTSFIPIYEQIKKEMKGRITQGKLKALEPLPSIRDLATDLIINPNTVARAYRELENEGFIYSRKGKGCYVADNSSTLVEKERRILLAGIFDQAIEEAKRYNLSGEEISRLFEQRLRRAAGARTSGGTNE